MRTPCFVDQQDYRHPRHTYGNYQSGSTMDNGKQKASTPNTWATEEDAIAEAELNLTGLKPTVEDTYTHGLELVRITGMIGPKDT